MKAPGRMVAALGALCCFALVCLGLKKTESEEEEETAYVSPVGGELPSGATSAFFFVAVAVTVAAALVADQMCSADNVFDSNRIPLWAAPLNSFSFPCYKVYEFSVKPHYWIFLRTE